MGGLKLVSLIRDGWERRCLSNRYLSRERMGEGDDLGYSVLE